MPILRILFSLLIPVQAALSGCAMESHGVGRLPAWWGEETIDQQLVRVGFALSAGSVSWCPSNRGWSYGLLVESSQDPGDRRTSESGDLLIVSYVYPGFPAEKAGIRRGDVVSDVNGQAVKARYGRELLVEMDRFAHARIQPVTLGIDSRGSHQQVDVYAIPVCPVHIERVEHSGINAMADGATIRITSGMLEFLRSEDELAWVLAHELAHNVMEHSQSARLEDALEAMLRSDQVQGALVEKPTRMQREIQADRIAADMLANAGFNLTRARGVLERFAALYHQRPDVFHSTTHPVPTDRLLSFDKAIQDIQARQARGGTPVPVFRDEGTGEGRSVLIQPRD